MAKGSKVAKPSPEEQALAELVYDAAFERDGEAYTKLMDPNAVPSGAGIHAGLRFMVSHVDSHRPAGWRDGLYARHGAELCRLFEVEKIEDVQPAVATLADITIVKDSAGKQWVRK